MSLEIDYTPPPTGAKFMQSNAKMRVLMGPVGSGKSVTCSFELIRRASMQNPSSKGVRKSRWAVVRETVRQLQDTTIKTFLDWFPPGQCGEYMRTTKTYHFKVGDVQAEIMFRALDDADDVANLNSLELTGAWFNECRDIHPDIVDAMSKRIGRYPSSKDGGPTWHGMWGDTNPPTMDTWWYYQLEKLDPADGVSPNNNGWEVFKQPSGRSIYAENIENLPEGYYDTQGRSDEYIRVYIDGEYGLSLAGTPVYKYFRPDYHMAQSPLRPLINGSRPVIVGMDLGLTPAAVIMQQDARGRVLILDERVSFDMGIQRFIRTELKPLLYERFAGATVLVVTDPAGIQRAQTDERSAVDIIKAEGLKVIPAKTNNISARVNAVDEFLMRQVDGDPAFLVDPRCTRLKAAMMGGYRYKAKQEGVIDKNKHSHCFVGETLIATPDGDVPIERLCVGDKVLTPFGVEKVTATMSRCTDWLFDVTLDDGTVITTTADHPFYTTRGVVLTEALQYNDVLLSVGDNLCQSKNGRSKSSMGSGITENPEDTTSLTSISMAVGTCTKTYGSSITDLFLKACASITETMIAVTMPLRISLYLLWQNMHSTTCGTEQSVTVDGTFPDLPRHGMQPRSGIENSPKHLRGESSLSNKDSPVGRTGTVWSTPAPTAEINFYGFVEQTSADIAVLHAKRLQELPAESMTKQGSALYVETISALIATHQLKHAPRIVGVRSYPTTQKRVYDLTVQNAHSFFAGGVWVSNCAEALQYGVMHIDSPVGSSVAARRDVARISAAGWT